uniref:Ice-binding protein C-terminal domain-containing protein n=1 Tax=Solibacter usitatus (strain Ellin6076) TaxID=234267 RepID=Q01Q89_SOLUE
MRRLFLVCLALTLASVLSAAPLCSTATLAVYDASGFSCSLGALTFGSFVFSAAGTTVPLPVDTAVLVIPIDDGVSTGLSFQGPFGAGAGLQLDASIAFVITSNPAIIAGDALAIQGFGVSGSGSVQVAESMCIGAIPSGSGFCGGTTSSLDVFDNSGGIKSFDSVSFSPVSTLAVSKDIMVLGGAAGTTSSAGVSLVINTTPPAIVPRIGGDAPEPSSVLLFGAGAGVILLRRRFGRA